MRARTMRARTMTVVVVMLAMLVTACGGEADDAATAGTTDDAATAMTEERAEGDDDGGDSDAATTMAPTDADGAAGAEPAPEAPAAVDGESESDSAVSRADDAQQVGLQAGSVDDNEAFEQYLQYRDDIAALGLQIPALDVAGRVVLTVVDGDDVPVHDAVVTLDGREARTGSDGRALVYVDPDRRQMGEPATVTIRHGDVEAEATLGNESAQRIVLDGAERSGVVRLDLLFLIDATGSMADEIERLRDNMATVAERIAASDADPDVRFALTSYRDVGDEYVARTVDFTSDVAGFMADLAAVEADGGGDQPEAFNEAFDQAVNRPSWRLDDDVVRLVVVVADAPPHLDRTPSYVDTLGAATAKGIRVFPIASSGTDDVAEFVFRQTAQATLGRFVFLTYGADGRSDAAVGGGSNVDEIGYDVLALDDLVVRLVEEELQPLAGSEAQ